MCTDESGTMVSTQQYMPSGEEAALAARASSGIWRSGRHERDTGSTLFDYADGLDYMVARYYSSGLARFMAVDPGDDTALEDPQRWNKYVYARNNPLGLVDPDGRDPINSVAIESLRQSPTSTPLQLPTAGQVKQFGENVGQLADTGRKAALLAAGVNAAFGDAPGAVASLAAAGGMSVVKTGADMLVAAADFSTQNVQQVGIDLAEHAGSAAVGVILDKAAPGAGELVKETAKEAIPAAATALATGIAGAEETQPVNNRPLIITTREAERQPVLNDNSTK
jgi:RHS repeat-associated protein